MLEIHYFQGYPLEWRLTSDDRKVIKASDVCIAIGWKPEIAAKKMDLIFPDYKFQSSFGQAVRPSWYLYEPGFFQLCFEVKTDQTIKLQRFVFELLPKLFRGEAAIVSTPQQALSIALPNTDTLTQSALSKRDSNIDELWLMKDVYEILPYATGKDGTKEHAVLNACSRALIYGHDYWYSNDDLAWVLTYAGLEYLITFARPTNPINLEVFGNTHVVLNLIRFLSDDLFPQPTNHYAPRVTMETSALMKSGQTDRWYPLSEQGLTFFADVWSGQNFAVWHEFRQLCSTLDTDRYVRFVRTCNQVRKFDNRSIILTLNDRGWIIEKHPNYSQLWTLKTRSKLLPSSDKFK